MTVTWDGAQKAGGGHVPQGTPRSGWVRDQSYNARDGSSKTMASVCLQPMLNLRKMSVHMT